MRMPTYISPSGLKTWKSNPDEYYMRYLCDDKPDRMPQTQAMAVGSAFDAYVKNDLFAKLLGKGHPDWPKYDLPGIFETQVEPHQWDWARVAGLHVFERYRSCGALADMLLELGQAAGDPHFEVEVRGLVGTVKGGVPLYGKPDVFFINAEGAHVIFDWKVNGYCSKSSVSPKPGYKMCRDAWEPHEGRSSRSPNSPHKDYYPGRFKGMEINIGCYLEDVDRDWAIQLATYGWLHGERVGIENVAGIDQIACAPTAKLPLLRVASHRSRISAEFQRSVIADYQDLWGRITSGHFYKELSKADSDARCAMLDERTKALYCAPDADTQIFNDLVAPKWK